ncbi:MAG: hypothetical protein Q9191_005574 [Dirinaria sp. TL-2023a]
MHVRTNTIDDVENNNRLMIAPGPIARRRSRTTGSISDYESARSLHEEMYLAHPSSDYSDSRVRGGPVTYHRQADQLSYAANSLYEPRALSEMPPSTVPDTGPRNLPEVTSYTPNQGPQGSQIYLYIQTPYDLAEFPLNISLMFATRSCTPTLDRLQSRGTNYQYLLAAEVPPHSSTGWTSPCVPVGLQARHASGVDAGTADVGSFFYTDCVQSSSRGSPPNWSRKRNTSEEPELSLPVKRTANQRLPSSSINCAASPYASAHNGGYSYSSQPANSVYAPSNLRSPSALQVSSSSPSTQGVRSSLERSSYHVNTASSRSSAWGSPFVSTAARQTTQSPALSSTSSRFQSFDSPSIANPPLIRTSTLQPSHSSSAVAVGGLYPYDNKAILKINGNLDSMADGWSNEEWVAKRRLVQFWRSQNGNTIDADFDAAQADSPPKGGIYVSCIWWAERRECYVTSVDTIHLLESLVGMRFPVEEKNRIRRNLEGFRPTTVSKGKTDSEDFFSIIMGFSEPKPRNIEKDVKVFPWKILAHALKKIFGKYSVSYSSTAGAMITPRSSTHDGYPEPNNTRPTFSSRSTSDSSSSTYTAYNTLPTTMSPHAASHPTATFPASYGGEASSYSVSAPDLPYTYSLPTLPGPYASQDQNYTSAAAQMPSASMAGRPSWDLAAYMNTTTSPIQGNTWGHNSISAHVERDGTGVKLMP